MLLYAIFFWNDELHKSHHNLDGEFVGWIVTVNFEDKFYGCK